MASYNARMTTKQEVEFQLELERLAKQFGYRLSETPSWSYGPGGITSQRSGCALWAVYDLNGKPSENFVVGFEPIPTYIG